MCQRCSLRTFVLQQVPNPTAEASRELRVVRHAPLHEPFHKAGACLGLVLAPCCPACTAQHASSTCNRTFLPSSRSHSLTADPLQDLVDPVSRFETYAALPCNQECRSRIWGPRIIEPFPNALTTTKRTGCNDSNTARRGKPREEPYPQGMIGRKEVRTIASRSHEYNVSSRMYTNKR